MTVSRFHKMISLGVGDEGEKARKTVHKSSEMYGVVNR